MVAYEGLRGVAFLDGLEEADLQELSAASSVRRIRVGDIVFREGDEADGPRVISHLLGN